MQHPPRVAVDVVNASDAVGKPKLLDNVRTALGVVTNAKAAAEQTIVADAESISRTAKLLMVLEYCICMLDSGIPSRRGSSESEASTFKNARQAGKRSNQRRTRRLVHTFNWSRTKMSLSNQYRG